MERISSKPVLGFLVLITILLTILYIILYGVHPTKHDISDMFNYKAGFILNLLTLLILFMTLESQFRLNRMQSKRDETDLVFSLYSQMDKDFDNIYVKLTTGHGNAKIINRYSGTEALNEFVANVCLQSKETIESLPAFGNFFETMQLDGVLKCYDLILGRLTDSPLPEDQKSMLTQKMKIFYSAKLDYACECLSKAFDDYPNLRDDKSDYLQQFYLKHKVRNQEVSA